MAPRYTNDVLSELQNLRSDVEQGFLRLNERIDAQQQNVRLLGDTLRILHDCAENQSHTLLAMQSSNILQEQKATIDGIRHKSITLMNEQNERIKIELGELERMCKEVDKELGEIRTAAKTATLIPLPCPTLTTLPATLTTTSPLAFSQENTSCNMNPIAKRPIAAALSWNMVGWLLVLILVLGTIPQCNALMTGPNGLTMYALNANGMVHEGKISQINDAIKMRRPHILVISETKTHAKVGNKMDAKEYNFFEETGVKMDNHHLYKWGIVVGVRKDIQVAQRLETVAALKGRVVVLDLVFGTNKGKGFLHRFIGTYAPWNPGTDVNETGFWGELAKISNAAAFSWSVAGDLNASVSNTERASGGTDARRHFLRFLDVTKGIDLWSDLKPQRSRLHDWTCKAHNNQSSTGNIIDRVVISANCAVDADIAVADKAYDFVQMTDHRAIISTILMRSPEVMNAMPDIPLELTENLHNPRVKYPSKKDKPKFEEYRKRVDQKIVQKGLEDSSVTSDISFIRRYDELTRIIVDTAKEVFGVTRKFDGGENKVTSPPIRRLEARLKHIGGALNLERRGPMALVSEKSRSELAHMQQEYQETRHSETDLRKFILTKRREVYKELYHVRMQEIISRARIRDRRKIAYTLLQGGSTRKMVTTGEYIGLPTAVSSHRNPGEIVTDPEGVKGTTCQYLTDLYNRDQPPLMEKPWMSTPSVLKIKEKVKKDPFEWPRKSTLADFRAMLRRGNQRPAPGPDGWEKWCVKNLSDRALRLVLDLHNYEVLNATFPGSVKDMTCTMFHKRNLRTDLSNWRGIMLSNFIANTPMTWLTNLLTTYSSRLNIVPETQVATQQGVQTRDVISYLSGIKCFAQRNQQTVYALQRDQMKGFDYLAPQGFYDAIEAYGLPATIANLDRAAQSNTKVFVRTAYGITGPIIVDAVTKQGGPASPLKSVLTTSLGHRYLDDISANEKGVLILETEASLKGREPHHPDHRLQVPVTMVEATDDSIIFATDLRTLQKLTLAMERFQFAYGWLTSWKKTVAYGICMPEDRHSNTLQMPSITPPVNDLYDPERITWHEVPLKLGELHFLRTRVDDPSGRFEELQEFIKNFRFPKFSIQTPITLARKIVMQNIVSRCRALLSLQPIKQTEAELLDSALAVKIHELLRFPYSPQPRILTLPLSHHGLDFPSITRINAGIAVEGIMRDLNHHIKAYRDVAKITYADWTCRFNNCSPTIDGEGLTKNFSHRYGQIPATWLTAHKTMGSISPKLSLRQTDTSYILAGDVSILHVANICKTRGLQILDGTAVNCLARKGITMLHNAGQWKRNAMGRWTFEVIRTPTNEGTWTDATWRSWSKLVQMIQKLQLEWLSEGDEELLLTRQKRREDSENRIRVLANLLDIRPSPNVTDDTVWASDGSMVPASAGILDDKTVTAALTGPKTMVMKLNGRNNNILHGEIFGLIMGHLLISRGDVRYLYTDHLNTVRFLQDSHSNINQDAGLRYRNGRSYLRWLKMLSDEARLTVEYTKGHSNSNLLASRLNADADHYATIAQSHIHCIPIAPTPTFTMNEFTFFRNVDGWIESNIRIYVDQLISSSTVETLGKGHRLRMSTWLYQKPNPPTYIYHKATSAYTAAVQLYARSGQLATAERVEKRQGDGNGGKCRLGCAEIEDEHHIFVDCPIFEEWRQEAGLQLQKTLSDRLEQTGIGEKDKLEILTRAKSFYMDDEEVWPLKESQFYLGFVPKIQKWMTHETEGLNWITKERMVKGIYCEWHNTGVRLASRIYGELQRRVTRIWERRKIGNGL
jgi:hypothetical protein